MVKNSIAHRETRGRVPQCAASASVLVLAVALALFAADARAAPCGNARPPEIRVTSEARKPDYRNALPRAQIGALAGRGHMTSDKRHAGLTQTRTDFSVRPVLSFVRRGDGTVCASLQQLEASWRIIQFQVDVAAEYRPGTCPYREILQHENQHVAIVQRAFAEADAALRRDLGDLARRTRPFVLSGTPERAAQQMAERFMAAARPALDRYSRDTERANAALDTPESYRAVSARCRDW